MDMGKQEMPPEGGFPSIKYKRHIPKRGPPGWVLLSAGFSVIIGGLVVYSKGRRIRVELEREKRQSRLMILPILQAESDLHYLHKRGESRKVEDELIGKNPDLKMTEKFYHCDRHVPQSYFLQDISRLFK